jgi:hypothetical protein
MIMIGCCLRIPNRKKGSTQLKTIKTVSGWMGRMGADLPEDGGASTWLSERNFWEGIFVACLISGERLSAILDI